MLFIWLSFGRVEMERSISARLQMCPKHVEVEWWNKLRINSASSWFLLRGCSVYVLRMYWEHNKCAVWQNYLLCIILLFNVITFIASLLWGYTTAARDVTNWAYRTAETWRHAQRLQLPMADNTTPATDDRKRDVCFYRIIVITSIRYCNRYG